MDQIRFTLCASLSISDCNGPIIHCLIIKNSTAPNSPGTKQKGEYNLVKDKLFSLNCLSRSCLWFGFELQSRLTVELGSRLAQFSFADTFSHCHHNFLPVPPQFPIFPSHLVVRKKTALQWELVTTRCRRMGRGGIN